MAKKAKKEEAKKEEIVEVEETENEQKKEKDKGIELNKVFYGSWITTLLFLALGLFLLIKPKLANSLIGYSVGAIVAISGIGSLVKYFMVKSEVRYVNTQLIYGILTIIAGLAIILNPLAISKIVIICLGIWMAINGGMKINTAIVLKRSEQDTWTLVLVIALLTILCGSMLIFNPFRGTMVVTRVIGVFILIYSVLDIMQWMLVRKNKNKETEFIK